MSSNFLDIETMKILGQKGGKGETSNYLRNGGEKYRDKKRWYKLGWSVSRSKLMLLSINMFAFNNL